MRDLDVAPHLLRLLPPVHIPACSTLRFAICGYAAHFYVLLVLWVSLIHNRTPLIVPSRAGTQSSLKCSYDYYSDIIGMCEPSRCDVILSTS